jgi:predicted transcriptional regulator
MTEDAAPPTDLIALTADIVTAYVAHNRLDATALPELIASVHAGLSRVGQTIDAIPEAVVVAPAITARKSLADPDRIISMVDGKPYASLKRHLRDHGLTPDDYRTRYKLPDAYPMVAPGYSAQRRTLAKAIGLGRKAKAPAPKAAAPKAKARRRTAKAG